MDKKIIDNNVQIIAISKSERDYNEILKPLKAIYSQIEILNSNYPMRNYLRFALKLLKLFNRDKNKIKIIIGDLWIENDLWLYFLRLFLDIKVIIKLKGDILTETRDKITDLKKKNKYLKLIAEIINYYLAILVLKNADAVIPVSNYLKNCYSFSDDWKVVNIPCDEERFKKKNYSPVLKRDHIKILAVTDFKYLRKIKGLKNFIEDYYSFLEVNNLQLDIAGGGYLLEDFKKRFINKKSINYLGYVKDIEQLYYKYDLFVHFSYLDGYPNTVLEAQSSKVPVIVNNCCGMMEQIKNGKNGVIVDLKNKQETTKKILQLVRSKRLRKKFGENGLKNVKKNNDYKSIGSKLNGVVYSLLK